MFNIDELTIIHSAAQYKIVGSVALERIRKKVHVGMGSGQGGVSNMVRLTEL